MSALRRRYGLARAAIQNADRWLDNVRKWFARAELEAPKELLAYRRLKGGPKGKAALARLEAALR